MNYIFQDIYYKYRVINVKYFKFELSNDYYSNGPNLFQFVIVLKQIGVILYILQIYHYMI